MISTIAAAARDQRRRRMLLPISTLLAAVTIAGVSGANFNASTANPVNSYSTGTFTMTNTRADTHVFDASNLKPGDTVTGSVTITNSGSLPALLEVTETATNGFVDASNLVMIIEEDDVEIFNGTFGDFNSKDLGEWDAGESRTYDFAVQLKLSATVTEQDRSASAAYQWDSVQVNDGDSIDGQA